MATANTQQLTQVTGLYTALFDRAPDTAGLSFWADALANGADISTVTQGFLAAPEGVANYPSFQTGEQFISTFYSKVLGREPDAAGLSFWTTALDSAGGAESTAARASVVTQLTTVVGTQLEGQPPGLSDADYAQTVADRAAFANKVEVGKYYATNFATDDIAARTLLDGVDDSPASVIAAKAGAFNAAFADGEGDVVGTVGDDAFVATIAQIVAGNRLIDGGAGTDTLAINGEAGGVLTEGRLSNVEIVDISNAGKVNGGTIAVDKVFGDIKQVNLSGTTGSPVTLTGAAGKTLGLLGTGAVILDVGAAATSADIAVQSADDDGSTLQAVGDSLNTLNVSGSGELELTQGAGTLKTVNLAANGPAPLQVEANALENVTLDASASIGEVHATVGSSSSYVGGANIDQVTIAAAPTQLLDGGAGDQDVLVIDANEDVLAASAGNIANFETLSIAEGRAGSFNAAPFQHLLLDQEAGAVSFDNVAAGTDLTLAESGQNVSYNLADASGDADALALNLVSDGALDVGTVTAAGIETVNIDNTSSAADSATTSNKLALTAADATTVVVTGNTGLELVNDLGNSKITSVDATGATAGLNFVSHNTTVGAAVSIKGAENAGNTLSGGVTNDTIIGGAGNDVLAGGTGLDFLTGGAGNDTFKLSPNANAQTYTTITDFAQGDSLDLSGAGLIDGDADSTPLTHVTLDPTATLDQFLAAAASVNPSGSDAAAAWFVFDSDAYVVIDNTANANTFVNGDDQLVKLAGVTDLSTAAIFDHTLTLV